MITDTNPNGLIKKISNQKKTTLMIYPKLSNNFRLKINLDKRTIVLKKNSKILIFLRYKKKLCQMILFIIDIYL